MNGQRCILRFIKQLLSITAALAIAQQSFSQGIKHGMWNSKHIDYADGQICIKLQEGVTENDLMQTVGPSGGIITKSPDTMRWALVKLPLGTDVFPVIESLAESPFIETCGPNILGHTLFDPNDDHFNEQWPLSNPGGFCDELGCCIADEDINVLKAWDITLGSPTIPIAVLDSGIPLDLGSDPPILSHPDLADENRIILGPDYIIAYDLDETEPTIKDEWGHGTHIAGIIGATTNNGLGIAGVAGSCQLQIYQVVGGTGNSFHMACYDGVVGAVNAGARVINFSVGFEDDDLGILGSAIDYARDAVPQSWWWLQRVTHPVLTIRRSSLQITIT